ncbi:UNVERIFIED_CONTAM: Tuberculostearic acid methyltransferase UfaA1 [Sesamum calycinum]|uniref:Tuberculostearic acid methyltransferase UfaA1 n=1 Tax=Sesamum calycinum TaxID=2727403 RepID=A0AAW2ISF8_9LAMI
MSRMRLAVVGGGVSGLTAAYILAKDGAEVVVYEKEDTLGARPRLSPLMALCSTLALRSLVAYIEELESNPDIGRNETLEHYIQSRGYSELFQKAFLIPTCASIWSCSSGVMSFSAYSILSFLHNDPALQLVGRPHRVTPRWCSQSYVNRLVARPHTPRWCSQSYVDRVKKELESRGCHVRTNSEVYSVLTNDEGCAVISEDGPEEVYDGCIIAVHAPDALKMLGKQATYDESQILGAFQYACSDLFVHHENNLMPKNPAVWSSRNFLGTIKNKAYVTYWLNNLQKIGETGLPFFLTLDPPKTPKNTLFKWSTSQPIPSVAASKALYQLNLIQGKRRLWFCGAYQGCGLPEDGVKVATKASLGFADAYIDGDFSFVDKNDGLLNFFLIFIANTEFNTYASKLNNKRGWRTPLFYTSMVASAKYVLKYALRQNTINQARRNVLQHYDLNNELFSLFMDETMSYSCAIFETPNEDLKDAQLRKIHTLIDKVEFLYNNFLSYYNYLYAGIT